MKYLLDTNTCIRYLNRRSENIIRKMEATSPDELVVCSVTRAELIFGAIKSDYPAQNRAKQNDFLEPLTTLSFDDQAAEKYGIIRALLERAGTPIGPNDLLIAAIALDHNLILVTHNSGEFRRVPDLLIEDWEL